jgi:hypothetical protein
MTTSYKYSISLALGKAGARTQKMAIYHFRIATPPLFCTAKMPLRKLLHIWPALPLVINLDYRSLGLCNPKDRFENLIAALEHRDRIFQIDIIDPPDSIWQQPFPALKSLWLESH